MFVVRLLCDFTSLAIPFLYSFNPKNRQISSTPILKSLATLAIKGRWRSVPLRSTFAAAYRNQVARYARSLVNRLAPTPLPPVQEVGPTEHLPGQKHPCTHRYLFTNTRNWLPLPQAPRPGERRHLTREIDILSTRP
jgi:hypothetical protein